MRINKQGADSLAGYLRGLKRASENVFFLAFPVLAPYVILPRYIVVESVNYCNLKCPVCATSQHMRRAKGAMSIDLFSRLLRQIDWKVKMLNFGYSGEPLLNKDLFLMIQKANSKGMPCGFDTNGTLVEDFAGEIVDSEVSFINIALDGVSQETIGKYRIGSDFSKIVNGIKKLVKYRKSKNRLHPVISLQFLIMRHNEGELEDIKRLAGELGVDELRIKTFNLDLGFWLSPDQKKEISRDFLPVNPEYSRYVVSGTKKILPRKRTACFYPFTSPVILHNGDVSLCCLDFNGEYIIGNITKNSLKDIWRSKLYRDYRDRIIGNRLEVCQKCAFGR